MYVCMSGRIALSFTKFYKDSVNSILEDFNDFNENGSDWIFEQVVDMQVNNASI